MYNGIENFLSSSKYRSWGFLASDFRWGLMCFFIFFLDAISPGGFGLEVRVDRDDRGFWMVRCGLGFDYGSKMKKLD